MNTKPMKTNEIEIEPPPPAVKPGWQTSEFWITAVASGVALLNSAFGWHIDPTSLAAVAGMIAAYALSRMGTKRAGTVNAQNAESVVVNTPKP